ncbi:MAG: DUF6051 family protein [Spirochaetota bacterium]
MTRLTTKESYHDLHARLAAVFDIRKEVSDLRTNGSACEIHTFPFRSQHNLYPPGGPTALSTTVRALISFFLENNPFSRRHFARELESADGDVVENREFRYIVFLPARTGGASGARATSDARGAAGSRDAAGYGRATLLLHGLNEKSWHKYLPWAARLTVRTGRPVILFPIAFHMNRAPSAWADPREMMGVAKERARLFPGLVAGSFANAALSHRVQFAPHRFLTSGLETYVNLVDLVRSIRDGSHPFLAAGARVDLFGYSIGASLSQLLLMANRDGLFTESRAFLFCGGSVLDRANPVSKAIMDNEAHRALVGFLAEFERDPTACMPLEPGFLAGIGREIKVIGSMIFADRRRETRESVAGGIAARARALLLERDRVFAPDGMRDSWRSATGAPILDMDVEDPPYEFSHEQPFPHSARQPNDVARFFETTMERVAGFLE